MDCTCLDLHLLCTAGNTTRFYTFTLSGCQDAKNARDLSLGPRDRNVNVVYLQLQVTKLQEKKKIIRTEMNFFYQRNAFDIHGMDGERDIGSCSGAGSRVERNLLAHCKYLQSRRLHSSGEWPSWVWSLKTETHLGMRHA